MPITDEAAYECTDPSLSEEERKRGAAAIVAGVAASDAYWNSRSPIEQVIAVAQGHGQVPTFSDLNDEKAEQPVDPAAAPEQLPSATPIADAAVVDPTGPGDGSAEDKLREQIKALGGTPEA